MERIRRPDALTAEALGRLLLALLVSVGLHAALLVSLERRPHGAAPPVAVHARLVPAPAASAPQSIAARPAPPTTNESVARALPRSAAPVQQPGFAPPEVPPAVPEALQPALDLRFYPAAALDVYPAPMQPIRLEGAPVSEGWIRILTSIGETGQVVDAVVLEAQPPAALEATALNAVRQARFKPALRDGVSVRSRVLIELRLRSPAQADSRAEAAPP